MPGPGKPVVKPRKLKGPAKKEGAPSYAEACRNAGKPTVTPQPTTVVYLDDSFWEKLICVVTAINIAARHAKRDSDIIAAASEAAYGMLGKQLSGAQLFEMLKAPQTPNTVLANQNDQFDSAKCLWGQGQNRGTSTAY